jgi:hypothetical protein
MGGSVLSGFRSRSIFIECFPVSSYCWFQKEFIIYPVQKSVPVEVTF